MTIICSPTPWFYKRGFGFSILLIIFAVLFFLDGTYKYKEENEAYLMYRIFATSGKTFDIIKKTGDLNEVTWNEFLSEQKNILEENRLVLPKEIDLEDFPPKEIQNFQQIQERGWHALWKDYSYRRHFSVRPPEKFHKASDLKEQILFFYILSFALLFLLGFIFTVSRRSFSLNEQGIILPSGKCVPYNKINGIDLKKWEKKGLAILSYHDGKKQRKQKFDGFIYGGFVAKLDQKEAAEEFMQQILKSVPDEKVKK